MLVQLMTTQKNSEIEKKKEKKKKMQNFNREKG
jgi:hypothetical protein